MLFVTQSLVFLALLLASIFVFVDVAVGFDTRKGETKLKLQGNVNVLACVIYRIQYLHCVT